MSAGVIAASFVASDYASAVLADSPLLWWRLDEPSGTTALDSSGHGFSGTATGTFSRIPGLVQDGGTAYNFTAGTAGIGPTSGLGQANGSSYTIEAWIKTSNAAATDKAVAGYAAAATTAAGTLFVASTHKPGFQVYNTANAQVGLGGPNVVNNGLTHHLVGVVDAPAATGRLYVDGVEVANGTITGTVRGFGPFKACSNSSNGQVYLAALDNVAMYPSALSAARVVAHYAAGIAA